MSLFTEFPTSVIEKLGYYVYSLVDPENNEIFYIGKGIGNRIFAHVAAALRDEVPGDRLDKIRSIRARGQNVGHIVQRHGLSEKEAFEVEAALIDFIGLTGLTNQVHGYNSDDRGRMKLDEIIAKYQAPAAVINEPAILITVNRLYERGMNSEALYEITRGKWVIGPRRNNARYAFAVYRGIIREVYRIFRWLPVTIDNSEVMRAWMTSNSPGAEVKKRSRWQFEGEIAEEMRSYINTSTESYQVVGAQNPIRYVNC